jgi:hypothetical protein
MPRTLSRIALALILLVTAWWSARPALPAHAATTWTVSTCDESHLRSTISGAAAGDTVTFSCSGTITLTNPQELSSDLTIDGSGQQVTIVAGSGTALSIDPGTTVTIKDLTFTNCDNAISNSGSLTIIDSTFSNNVTVSPLGGGAIVSVVGTSSPTLTIIHSTFSDNSAVQYGGAIEIRGSSLNVTDSTFSGNNTSIYGGAIDVASGTATISNSTFSGNYLAAGAGGFGGAISLQEGTTTITNSTFSGNSAGYGGAIDNARGSLTVINSTLDGNYADSYANGILTGTIVNDALAGGGTTMLKNTIMANGPVRGAAGPLPLVGTARRVAL